LPIAQRFSDLPHRTLRVLSVLTIGLSSSPAPNLSRRLPSIKDQLRAAFGISSGAAIDGSPLSDGYAGAKPCNRFLPPTRRKVSDARNPGIRLLAMLRRSIKGDGRDNRGGFIMKMVYLSTKLPPRDPDCGRRRRAARDQRNRNEPSRHRTTHMSKSLPSSGKTTGRQTIKGIAAPYLPRL
jgi:hypothetical protein